MLRVDIAGRVRPLVELTQLAGLARCPNFPRSGSSKPWTSSMVKLYARGHLLSVARQVRQQFVYSLVRDVVTAELGRPLVVSGTRTAKLFVHAESV